MSTTYAQKQAPTQKKDAPTAASILDTSSQSESLQRKADMANATMQRVAKCSTNFFKNHTLFDGDYDYFKAHCHDARKDKRFNRIAEQLQIKRIGRHVLANSVVRRSTVEKDSTVKGWGTTQSSVSESIKTSSLGSALISGSSNSNNRVYGQRRDRSISYTHFHGSNPG